MITNRPRFSVALIVSVITLLFAAVTPALAASPQDPALANSTSTAAKVVATIPVGPYPNSVAVNPTTNRIYTLNSGDDTMSVIDGTTNHVIATIPLTNSTPIGWFVGVVVDFTTNQIFDAGVLQVCNPDGCGNWPNLWVIDGASNAVVNQVQFSGYGSYVIVGGIDVDPSRHVVYVTENYDMGCYCGNYSDVAGYTETTNTTTKGVSGGHFSPGDGVSMLGAIAVNPGRNTTYVATSNGGTSGGSAIYAFYAVHAPATIDVSPNPNSIGPIAVNPKTNRIFASVLPSVGTSALDVIDGTTNAVISSIAVSAAGGISVNRAGNHVYVVDAINAMSIIDGTTNLVITSLSVGKGPHGVTANPLTGRVYVANSTDGTVSVIQDGK